MFHEKRPHGVGFKPAEAVSCKFLVYRLNHSAIQAVVYDGEIKILPSHDRIARRSHTEEKIRRVFKITNKCEAGGSVNWQTFPFNNFHVFFAFDDNYYMPQHEQRYVILMMHNHS